MNQKFTQENLQELLDRGLITPNNFLLTEHYLVVPVDGCKKLYDYLFEKEFIEASSGTTYKNGGLEYISMWINRNETKIRKEKVTEEGKKKEIEEEEYNEYGDEH